MTIYVIIYVSFKTKYHPHRYPYRFQVQEEQASPKSYTRLNANSNASDLDGFLSLLIQVLLPRRSEVPRFLGSLV